MQNYCMGLLGRCLKEADTISICAPFTQLFLPASDLNVMLEFQQPI